MTAQVETEHVQQLGPGVWNHLVEGESGEHYHIVYQYDPGLGRQAAVMREPQIQPVSPPVPSEVL